MLADFRILLCESFVFPFALQEKGDTNSKGENGIENEDERKIFSILVETPDITAKGMSEHTGFSFFVFAREAGSLLISGPKYNVDHEGKANCIQTPLITFYGYKTFPFAGSLFRRNTKSPGFLKIQGL